MSAPADLPFDLDSLPPAVREAFAAMQAKVAGLEAHTERQDYLIAELRHALYGKRSEQLPPDERQLAFEDLETAVAEAEAAREALVERNADGKPRRPAAKRNLGNLPDHLPRIEQVIEPAQKICPCGCTDMVKIGEGEPLRRQWFKPNGERRTARHRSGPLPGHRHHSPPLCLPPLRRRCCAGGHAQLADRRRFADRGHARPLSGHCCAMPCRATHVAVSKYADHLPLYRQCQIYGRGGVNLDRSTLANWCGVSAYHLAPVVDRMLVHLKRSGRLFMPSRQIAAQSPAG